MDDPIRKLFDPAFLPARSEFGTVEHPDLSRFTTNRDGDQYVDLAALKAAGWEHNYLRLEGSDDAAAHDRYFDAEDPDFSGWNPAPPEPGFVLVAMWEDEDGPIAFYVREVATA